MLDEGQEICTDITGGFRPVVVDFGQIAKPNTYLLKLRAGVKLLLRGVWHQTTVRKSAKTSIPPPIPPKPDSQALFHDEV
jgi:hypothetical protein